jgi:hypothetical protein
MLSRRIAVLLPLALALGCHKDKDSALLYTLVVTNGSDGITQTSVITGSYPDYDTWGGYAYGIGASWRYSFSGSDFHNSELQVLVERVPGQQTLFDSTVHRSDFTGEDRVLVLTVYP